MIRRLWTPVLTMIVTFALVNERNCERVRLGERIIKLFFTHKRIGI